jgi:hypothetical protein
MKKAANRIETTATTVNKTLRLIFVFDILTALSCVADGGFKESQLYYTTPQANNQAEDAGNAKEINDRTPADFLPGACRTGGG